MGTAKKVDTFLLPLLLLSIFVNFITKKAYYTSPDGISITFHRCDLYDGPDSFVLSTFHRINLKYVTTTKKSVCLLLLLCGDIESQPGPTNNSEFKTLISKKGINFCHQNIRSLHGKIDKVREILLSYNFDIFSLSETSISEDFHNAFFDIRGYSFIRRD